MNNDVLEMKVDLLLAKCRIRSDITQAMQQGEMNKNGPFFIDRNAVPVEFYQRSLFAGSLDEMTVLSDIARLCGWQQPVYKAVNYYVLEGFLCSVDVCGTEFVSEWRGWSPKLAQNLAAATFLKFLGFAFNVDASVFPGWSHLDGNRRFLQYVFGEKLDASQVNVGDEMHSEAVKRTQRPPDRSLMQMERLFKRMTRTPSDSVPNPPKEVDGEVPIEKMVSEMNASFRTTLDNLKNTSQASASQPNLGKPIPVVGTMNCEIRSIRDRIEARCDERPNSNSKPKVASKIVVMNKRKEVDIKEHSLEDGPMLTKRIRSSEADDPRSDKRLKFIHEQPYRSDRVHEVDSREKSNNYHRRADNINRAYFFVKARRIRQRMNRSGYNKGVERESESFRNHSLATNKNTVTQIRSKASNEYYDVPKHSARASKDRREVIDIKPQRIKSPDEICLNKLIGNNQPIRELSLVSSTNTKTNELQDVDESIAYIIEEPNVRGVGDLVNDAQILLAETDSNIPNKRLSLENQRKGMGNTESISSVGKPFDENKSTTVFRKIFSSDREKDTEVRECHSATLKKDISFRNYDKFKEDDQKLFVKTVEHTKDILSPRNYLLAESSKSGNDTLAQSKASKEKSDIIKEESARNPKEQRILINNLPVFKILHECRFNKSTEENQSLPNPTIISLTNTDKNECQVSRESEYLTLKESKRRVGEFYINENTSCAETENTIPNKSVTPLTYQRDHIRQQEDININKESCQSEIRKECERTEDKCQSSLEKRLLLKFSKQNVTNKLTNNFEENKQSIIQITIDSSSDDDEDTGSEVWSHINTESLHLPFDENCDKGNMRTHIENRRKCIEAYKNKVMKYINKVAAMSREMA